MPPTTAAVSALLAEHRCDALMNATDPRFVMPLFRAALAGGAHYLDMAMSLSKPHPTDPYSKTGVKLGDEQFALAGEWEQSGRLALVGIGIEPGMADVFARYAADELFSEIEELGVRDGANLIVAGYDFAPSFSIWTTIEECLNPPVIYEKDRGWFTTPPFSEPEVFEFPDGIGPVECVNVEHEEVLLMPRWIDAGRVTFKYGLGEEVHQRAARCCTSWGWTARLRSRWAVSRFRLATWWPRYCRIPRSWAIGCPAKPAPDLWVKGTGKDGAPRQVYLYHVVDNEWSMREYGAQAVVWQTALNPVVALELMAVGVWAGAGVLGPEALPPKPFLDLVNEYGSPWGMREEAEHRTFAGSATDACGGARVAWPDQILQIGIHRTHTRSGRLNEFLPFATY